MLSCLGSRCRAYPQMKTFDQTLDLFLSMAPPKRGEKKTRRQIRSALVVIMSSGYAGCCWPLQLTAWSMLNGKVERRQHSPLSLRT